jgi:hypothetical protein
MAFTATNTQRTTVGHLKAIYGTFTCSIGDAAGSINVDGGRVWLASINGQDSSGAMQMHPFKISTSTSGAVTTITVYNLTGVTSGRFFIIYS